MSSPQRRSARHRNKKRPAAAERRKTAARSPLPCYLAAVSLEPCPPTFVPDREALHALLYCLGLNQVDGVSLHGYSFVGPGYRLIFSASEAERDVFLDAVARDMAAFFTAYLGLGRCRIELQELTHLPDADSQMRALRKLALDARDFLSRGSATSIDLART